MPLDLGPPPEASNDEARRAGRASGESASERRSSKADDGAIARDGQNFFARHAPALIDAGYLVVPIEHGRKKPALPEWQNARLDHRHVARWRRFGVGILTGQGEHPIAAVDIDTTDRELAEAFAQWCRDHLGATVERVGNAPKLLLAYRAAKPWPKLTGEWFEDLAGKRHRVEVLGKGEQFVAYHVHPDTKRPYEWVDLLGGLTEVRAAELPVISRAQVDEALSAFREMAIAAGMAPVGSRGAVRSDAASGAAPAGADDFDREIALASVTDATIEELRSALAVVDADDRDTWVRMGHALKDLGDTGYQLWIDYSERSVKFDADDATRVWESLRPTGTDYRAVFAEAQRRGWINPRSAVAGGKPARRQRTEFGNAERIVDRFGEVFMFVPEFDAWFVWTGSVWQETPAAMIACMARDTVQALPEELKQIEAEEEREKFLKFCAASQRAAMVRAMVDMLAKDRRVLVPAAELDRDRHLLGVANGAVDLRTGALLPPDPKLRITIMSPVAYDSRATAPLFEQTVAEVFNDDHEMVSFFQRLIGYALTGNPREDVFVIAWGDGSNGKSTVFDTIRKVLGRHAKTAKADTFVAQGGAAGGASGPREDLLRLRGTRFVYITEPEEGAELREGLVKSVTGGEPIPARGVYGKTTLEVVPTWTPFMPTNHRPIIKGTDFAIWRRLLLLPFTRNFDTDPLVTKDVSRADKLMTEAPGILRWCVDGALAYRKEGLRPPAPVVAARSEYRDSMDLLREWLDACCDIGPRFESSTADLWMSWRTWAECRGELRLIASSRALGRRLAARFAPAPEESRRRLGGRGFTGLRVRGERI